MKRRSPLQILLLVLCVFTLLGAQIFGGPLRFLCDCGGRTVVTQAAHCFGPDHTHCHAEGQNLEQSSHDGTDSANRKEHQVAKDEVQVRLGEAAPQVVAAPVLVVLAPAMEALFAVVEWPRAAWPPAEAGDRPPPAGVAVARTVVFLI